MANAAEWLANGWLTAKLNFSRKFKTKSLLVFFEHCMKFFKLVFIYYKKSMKIYLPVRYHVFNKLNRPTNNDNNEL